MVESTKIKIKEIGIRPSEKIHEIMVSNEEANYTIKKGDYYAIKSMLPELSGTKEIKNALKGEFSSEHTVLNKNQTRVLLKKNNLLPGMNTPSESGEFLA